MLKIKTPIPKRIFCWQNSCAECERVKKSQAQKSLKEGDTTESTMLSQPTRCLVPHRAFTTNREAINITNHNANKKEIITNTDYRTLSFTGSVVDVWWAPFELCTNFWKTYAYSYRSREEHTHGNQYSDQQTTINRNQITTANTTFCMVILFSACFWRTAINSIAFNEIITIRIISLLYFTFLFFFLIDFDQSEQKIILLCITFYFAVVTVYRVSDVYRILQNHKMDDSK